MGRGVSHAFARAGTAVILVDTDPAALKAAREQIAHDARMSSLIARGRARSGPADLSSITYTTDLRVLANAHYVVENITEDRRAKLELYRCLDEICLPGCILAVNTSAIPVTGLAGVTRRPGLVVGNHFMNPAHLMPTVEVVRGLRTAPETIQRSQEVLAGIGKDSVVVNDSSGFVTNRVAMLAINEAIFLASEGVCAPKEIDQLFRQCLGHSMGPLETADLIGLDTVLYSLEVLLEEFSDAKYRPCPLLRRYVEAGWLGRKSGRGFHQYTTDTSTGKASP